MTSIISNLLARRGRRNTYESQLDSTWGDMRITSPTDTARIWHPQKPEVALTTDKQPTPELYDGATPVEMSQPTPTDVSAFSKFDFGTFKSDSPSAFSFLPTPRYAPLHTPPQLSCQAQQGLAIFDGKMNVAADIHRVPSTGLMRRRGNNNTLAIHGVQSPVSGSMSPTYTTQGTPALSQVGSPMSPIQPGDHVVCIPSRRPLSPAEITALARRPSTTSQTASEHVCSPTHQYYSSLNGAAVESLQSPVVTILSPVSETFSLNGGLQDEDGIIVLDVIADSNQKQLLQRSRSHSRSNSDLEELDLTPVNPVSLDRLLREPSNHHYDISAQLDDLASVISSRPQSEAGSAILDNDAISVFMSPSTQANEFESESRSIHEFNADVSSISLHSASEASIIASQIRRSPTIVSESTSIRSPPLGAKEAMRMLSPPLSTTARMRVQSPPTASRAWEPPSNRGNNSAVAEWLGLTSHTDNPVSRVQRQRRASLEPPPSPSLFDRDALFAQPLARNNAATHLRQQSNDSAHIYVPVREYGNYVQDSAYGYQLHSNVNLPAYQQRKGSQSTFTTPNLQSQSTWSKSPQIHTNIRAQFADESSYYDSIREDCRVVSRESRAAKNEALMAQFKASAEPARSDKHTTRVRARSTSRVRDRFNREQPKIEMKQAGPQTQLVASYTEMWE